MGIKGMMSKDNCVYNIKTRENREGTECLVSDLFK